MTLTSTRFLRPPSNSAIENLLPGAEIEFAIGDGDDNLASHHLPLHVCIGIILAGPVVAIARDRLVRGQFFEPDLIVVVQATLIVIDEYRCRDVHGVDQHQPFLHTAVPEAGFDIRRDVDELAPAVDVEPQFFAIALHV